MIYQVCKVEPDMNKKAAQSSKSPTQLIDERIEEFGDWQGDSGWLQRKAGRLRDSSLAACSVRRELSATADGELAENVRQVGFDRAARDEESGADLGIAEALRDKFDDFAFGWTERLPASSQSCRFVAAAADVVGSKQGVHSGHAGDGAAVEIDTGCLIEQRDGGIPLVVPKQCTAGVLAGACELGASWRLPVVFDGFDQ